jgi:hypothetical protein
MADPEDVARIRAYLQQHKETYEQQALRAKLLEDGHDPQAVELALAQTYGFQVAPSTPPVGGNTTGRLLLVITGTLLFNYVVLPIIVVLLLQVGATDATSFFLGAIVPTVLALVVEVGAALALRRTRPVVARGIGWGILISLIPVAGLALLFGACVALLRF